MADTPNIQPPQNVAALTSPDIITNLKASKQPQAFGDQLTKTAIAAGTNAALNSTIARLYKQKADLIAEGIKLDVQHQSTLLKYENQLNIDKKQAGDDPQKLSDAEKSYRDAVAIEDINYAAAKENLAKRKEENQKDIEKYLADPFAKQKEKRKARQAKIKKLKSRSKQEKQKARKERRKAVLQNARKTIVAVLALLLTDKITDIISQNDTIQRLVDEANIIIEAANISNDPIKLQNAKVVRDNALTVIQNNEEKIIKIKNIIERVTLYITIFGTIISIINAILNLPIPALIPLKIKLQPLLEKALRIVAALGALLAVVIISLEKVIQTLNDYRTQLLQINGQIDSAASSIPDLNALLGLNFGTNFLPYKGFRFALKEENNPRFEVRGNKRHFAVAFDRNNVEVLKSEPSFTLDPNDLIEQLKLVIDQQNLIA
jgi:hypothetical protein